MMNHETALARWHDALQAVLDAQNGPLRRVWVLRSTDSTQDAARRMHAAPGDVIVAARQTAGRGRLGRAWADTSDEGIAVTFVLSRDDQHAERLAIAGAIAAASAAEALLQRPVGIKWPNDIVVNGGKLAGVLVEQHDAVAMIGIGMNILQPSWPEPLARLAVSILQLGATVQRIDALKTLLETMDKALSMSDDALSEAFEARDVLLGRTVTVLAAGRRMTGIVRRVDPLQGLLLEIGGEEIRLPAATTSIAAGQP